jgi:hypothetical protein
MRVVPRRGAGKIQAGRPLPAPYSAPMQTALAVLPYLIGLAMIGVVVSLFAGLFSMARGSRASNTLMRWRVGTQATAIILAVIYFLLLKAM